MRYDVFHQATGFMHVVDDAPDAEAAAIEVAGLLEVDVAELAVTEAENQEPTPEADPP